MCKKKEVSTQKNMKEALGWTMVYFWNDSNDDDDNNDYKNSKESIYKGYPPYTFL